jgi:hypothetical protein
MAEAPRRTRTGLLLTKRFVRPGKPFRRALACFITRGPAANRFPTTASAEPVVLPALLAAFFTTFVTERAESADFSFFWFGFMSLKHSDNRAKSRGL